MKNNKYIMGNNLIDNKNHLIHIFHILYTIMNIYSYKMPAVGQKRQFPYLWGGGGGGGGEGDGKEGNLWGKETILIFDQGRFLLVC